MKSLKNIKIICLIALLPITLFSCEDFLNRPTEDNFNVDNFYQNEEQCFQAVNPIYNSPWYDMQRFFIKAGEILSGNIYNNDDNNPYLRFTVTGSDANLGLASASLWSVNAYCNGVIQNIDMKSASGISEDVKNTVKGEALVWKAMTYFFLVRTFGAVPIIHDNSEMIAAATYNDVYKATIPNVYDYIIMTLEQAIEWLPEKNAEGRIDRYSAYGLLAKVYLTKSGYGQSGTRNQEDLDNAARYAKMVIDNSGRNLLENYADIFRLGHNKNEECLISWHWVSGRDPWTQQNTLQSDLSVTGFDEFASNWGTWTGPSVDLQDAFGENALSLTRNNRDTRRKATMMMYGDHYDYFWRDKGGFDWTDYLVGTLKEVGPVGAHCVKHLVGNNADHQAEGGGDMYVMANGLSTHILRLSDIYLIYAEAVIGNTASTSDAGALDAFNKVFLRACPGETAKTSITWNDVWKERRLELACEGDRWYDYVRWSYYNPDGAVNELKNQRRDVYYSLFDYYETGSLNPSVTRYNPQPEIPNPSAMYNSKLKTFAFPFPNTDVVSNPHLNEDPVDQDISQYKY